MELSGKIDETTWAFTFFTEFSTFTCTGIFAFVLTSFFETLLFEVLFGLLPSAHTEQGLEIRVLIKIAVSLSVSDYRWDLSVSAFVLADLKVMTASKSCLLGLSGSMVCLEKSS
jgi:hypothetical protein